jgi:hypothetical protein
VSTASLFHIWSSNSQLPTPKRLFTHYILFKYPKSPSWLYNTLLQLLQHAPTTLPLEPEKPLPPSLKLLTVSVPDTRHPPPRQIGQKIDILTFEPFNQKPWIFLSPVRLHLASVSLSSSSSEPQHIHNDNFFESLKSPSSPTPDRGRYKYTTTYLYAPAQHLAVAQTIWIL